MVTSPKSRKNISDKIKKSVNFKKDDDMLEANSITDSDRTPYKPTRAVKDNAIAAQNAPNRRQRSNE